MVVSDELLDFAGRLADASAGILRRRFRQPLTVEIKTDRSPVTAIDREVESTLREMIASEYPAHGVIGEEFGAERADAEHVWVLDPIDGTKSFITGRPLFGTLIALCRQGRPILGVIDHPVLGAGERWVGAAGRPTRHDGAVIHVRACRDLGVAALFGSSPHSSKQENEQAFDRLRRSVGQTLYSTDCYAFGLVASGFADIYVDFGLGIYDYLAAVPVIEGAGGIITDWNGGALTIDSGKNIVAAGDRDLHRSVLAKLAGLDAVRTST
jgi:inositol-phosphate phosphatase / L-galactose 1-phosphate phosphatase / histidinol-phosphatase